MSERKKGPDHVDATQGRRPRSLTIHLDANVFLTMLDPGESVAHALPPGRHAWLQVLRGAVRVNGTIVETSVGLAVSDEPSVTIVGERPGEVMMFDLA